MLRSLIHSDAESISSDTLATTTAETSFIEKVVDSPDLIKNLAGATDDELKAFGFTDDNIKEPRWIINACADLSFANNEHISKIKELENKRDERTRGDEELRAVGFTDEAIRDWREMRKIKGRFQSANKEKIKKLNKNYVLGDKPVERLIDAPEDELKKLGFSRNALRELRGLKQAGDDLAIDKRENHMLIEELGKKQREAHAKIDELKDTADDNLLEKTKLEKELEYYQEQLIEERKKVFDLENEIESQTSRLKRLITDVLKNFT